MLVVFRATLCLPAFSEKQQKEMIFLWTSIPLGTALMQLVPLAVSCDLQNIKDQEKNVVSCCEIWQRLS